MITFLPVKSFIKSLEFLDKLTLDRQIIEAALILEVLTDKPILNPACKHTQFVTPFNRHSPVWVIDFGVNMWRGYEEWLKLYLMCARGEWFYRGEPHYIDQIDYNIDNQEAPYWLGEEVFHSSHRRFLIGKLPGHYQKFWPNEQGEECTLVWPSRPRKRKEESPAQSDSERITNECDS